LIALWILDHWTVFSTYLDFAISGAILFGVISGRVFESHGMLNQSCCTASP
jgi:hypothetical protein